MRRIQFTYSQSLHVVAASCLLIRCVPWELRRAALVSYRMNSLELPQQRRQLLTSPPLMMPNSAEHQLSPSGRGKAPHFEICSVMDSFDFTAFVHRRTQALVAQLQQQAVHRAAGTAVGNHEKRLAETDPDRVLPQLQRDAIRDGVSREWRALLDLSVAEVEAAVWGSEGQGGWGLKNDMLTTCLVPYAAAVQIIVSRMPREFREVAQRELEHDESVREARKASQSNRSRESGQSRLPPPPSIPNNTLIQWKDIDVYRRKAPMVSGQYQRPPVISIMGHVDHGKTTLLDMLMQSNLCSREAGRITQSVRAFTINTATCLNSLRAKREGGITTNIPAGTPSPNIAPTHPYPSHLTIIVTPGHKAFSEMRLHSQLLSDFVLLLIALDEGIQGQTVEIVHVALNADRPIVVVFNKADKYTDMRMLASRLATVLEELKREGLHVRIVQDEADLGRLVSKPSKKHRGATVAEVYLLKQVKLDAKVSISSHSQPPSVPLQQQRRGTLYDPVIDSGSLQRRSLGVCISGLTGKNVELLLSILVVGAQLDSPMASEGSGALVQAQILEATKTVEGSSEASELGKRVHQGHIKRQDNDNTQTLQRQLSSRGSQGQHAADRALSDFSSSLMIITAIVRSGTLRPGMAFVADQAYGKVSMLCDYWGNQITEALPGTAVVIVDKRSKSGCPGVGTHVIQQPSLSAASELNEYRRHLQWFIQAFPQKAALLRPKGADARFMALGNYGQVDKKEDEKSLPYRLLYGGGERAENKERELSGSPSAEQQQQQQPNAAATAISPSTDVEGTPEHIEKKWASLQPERYPQTEDEMKVMQENAKILGVYLKVDTWHSARMLAREIPRMSTKHIIFNVMGARFGALSEDDIPHFGSGAQVIISYRTPMLSSSKVYQHLQFSKTLLLETSIYSEVITFLKTIAVEKHEEYVKTEFQSDSTKFHVSKTQEIIRGIGLSVKVGGSITDHAPLGNSQRGTSSSTTTSPSTSIDGNDDAALGAAAPLPQIVSRRRSKVALARGYSPDGNPYEH